MRNCYYDDGYYVLEKYGGNAVSGLLKVHILLLHTNIIEDYSRHRFYRLFHIEYQERACHEERNNPDGYQSNGGSKPSHGILSRVHDHLKPKNENKTRMCQLETFPTEL